jgi:hypothetical protein
VHSVGKHRFPLIYRDGWPVAAVGYQRNRGPSGSSLASRSALCVIGKPLIGLGDEVHVALGCGVGHSLSYSVRLLSVLAPIVSVVLRFHGFLPRGASICCNAAVIAGFPTGAKILCAQGKMSAAWQNSMGGRSMPQGLYDEC